MRTVGAFTRLGQPERAHAMLDFFFKDQRPRGWNQWAEVVLPDAREPRFLGDMPHAWVSSDYIRSALDLPRALPGLSGGLVLRWPEGVDLPRASHQGRALPWVARELALPAPPAVVELTAE